MSEDNKAVVRRFAQECWDKGDFGVADELVAEEVVRNGQPVGRRGLIAVIAAIRAAFPDFHTEVEDLVGEGDRVAWRYSSGGVHTGAPIVRHRRHRTSRQLDGDGHRADRGWQDPGHLGQRRSVRDLHPARRDHAAGPSAARLVTANRDTATTACWLDPASRRSRAGVVGLPGHGNRIAVGDALGEPEVITVHSG